MSKITITEALSEINLIKKKIRATYEAASSAVVRPKHMKDHFEKDGGSVEFIKRNVQKLEDLYRRMERIKGAISLANIENEITVGETTKTIFDWLTWKREISTDHVAFVSAVYNTTFKALENAAKNPQAWQDEEGNKKLMEVVSNIDLGEWLDKKNKLTEVLETLDGKLSLKNATILIDA